MTGLPPVTPGSRLGSYEITAALGAGGMGEVWRATDTNLGRDVAIKLLPGDFAADDDRHARFEREARLLASLNHPNIATLYGLEHLDGKHALIMELVDGEALDQRLARSAVPVAEAIPIAIQITEALEAAHEHGIVHRDLKPANVMVRPDGTVKVLDFGLAKAWATEGAASDPSLSPTLTRHATVEGVILGTAAYMSPEQARGKAVDRRADIWAFGVVLWEMLTGDKLFAGETVSDVLASVLTREISLDTLPSDTPPRVSRLIRRCLERDPRRRLQWIGDARLELAEPPSEPDRDVPHGGDRQRVWMGALPWALFVFAAVLAGWLGFHPPSAPDHPLSVEASILPPAGHTLAPEAGIALSPDGQQLAFVARDTNGVSRLWIRPLERANPHSIPNTEDAAAPFWSPDSRFIGFFSQGSVSTVELATGRRETVAKSRESVGASWGSADTIIYSSDWGRPLMKVAATGGEAREVDMPVDLDDDLNWPSFLPDGEHFLYLKQNYSSDLSMSELRLGSLAGGESKLLAANNSSAQFSLPRSLVWWYGGNLRAQIFDPDRLEFLGQPKVVASGVRFQPDIGLASFSVSQGGVLAFVPGDVASENQLTMVDRDGTVERTIGDPGVYYEPRLSPDGRFIALDSSDEANRGDIWVFDVERGTGTPLTTFPEDDTEPVWSPRGDAVAFCSNHGADAPAVFIKDLHSPEPATALIRRDGANLRPRSWTRNGDLLVYRRTEAEATELWKYSTADDSFRPYLSAPALAEDGGFSPDGRFVVYVSSSTGRQEIFVAPYPDPVQSWRVSLEGGSAPLWSPTGDEIFYLNPRSDLMSVSVDEISSTGTDGRTQSTLRFGTPTVLFRVDLRQSTFTRNYDTIDGRHFLINAVVRTGEASSITIVTNWDRELTEN